MRLPGAGFHFSRPENAQIPDIERASALRANGFPTKTIRQGAILDETKATRAPCVWPSLWASSAWQRMRGRRASTGRGAGPSVLLAGCARGRRSGTLTTYVYPHPLGNRARSGTTASPTSNNQWRIEETVCGSQGCRPPLASPLCMSIPASRVLPWKEPGRRPLSVQGFHAGNGHLWPGKRKPTNDCGGRQHRLDRARRVFKHKVHAAAFEPPRENHSRRLIYETMPEAAEILTKSLGVGRLRSRRRQFEPGAAVTARKMAGMLNGLIAFRLLAPTSWCPWKAVWPPRSNNEARELGTPPNAPRQWALKKKKNVRCSDGRPKA